MKTFSVIFHLSRHVHTIKSSSI